MKSFKLQKIVQNILTSIAYRLLVRISKMADGGTDNVAATLFPAWNQLVSKWTNLTVENELRFYARALLVNLLAPESGDLIPSLEKLTSPVRNTWVYQNEDMDWDIDSGELVLDIGSGGWPFKRADHLADRFPDNTTHRVEDLARDNRPFIEVDIEMLPFKDKSYDFIFCSHVLEHLNKPGDAIRELMRAGRRGYIEVPTRLSDVMFNFTRLPNHHRWHGLIIGNTLVLMEWNDWERRDLGNQYFNALQSEYKNQFQDFFARNRDLFFASYHWVGAIDFLVIDKQGVVVDSSKGQV